MRMTEREELLKRLERVKALAERGVGGEKENAEALLKRLMEKYEISDEDIEDTSTRTYFIRYQTQWERKLLHQIAYMHLGSGHSFGCVGTYTNRSRKKVGVECTPAQYIEIEADYEFFRTAMEEEMSIFYTAFISKNNLLHATVGYTTPDEEIDLVRAKKVSAFMMGIERRTRNKALPGTTEEGDDDE